MKKLLFSLLLTAGSAAAQGFALLPALQPWTLLWDNANSPSITLSYDLFYGTNKLATLTTNDYTILGVTNGVTTCSALVPAMLTGTNLVTLVAVNQIGTRSAPSLPLTVNALGEPLPPQALRP